MRRLLSLIFAIMAIAFHSVAETKTEENSTKDIILEYSQYSDDNKPHRAPMRISIEAYYETSTNSIVIYTNSNTEGEVFLYQNGIEIGYDSQINTTLSIPTLPGTYVLEIVGGSWIAKGTLTL